MTQIYSPPNGGKRWLIGEREAGVWFDNNLVMGYFAGFFINEEGTGWLCLRTLKTYGTFDEMKDAVAASGGMGNELVALKPSIQAALNSLFTTQPLPAHTNAEPASAQGMNDVIGTWLEVVTPRPGDTAPFACLTYQIPAGSTPYTSTTTQASPLWKRVLQKLGIA